MLHFTVYTFNQHNIHCLKFKIWKEIRLEFLMTVLTLRSLRCGAEEYGIRRHSFISIQPWRPGFSGTRAQSCDRYGSGTLHSGQVLGGSLPLLSTAFRRSHFSRQVPPSATRREILAAKGNVTEVPNLIEIDWAASGLKHNGFVYGRHSNVVVLVLSYSRWGAIKILVTKSGQPALCKLRWRATCNAATPVSNFILRQH